MTPEAAMRLFNWAMAAVKNDPSATVDILVEKVVEAHTGAVAAERERITDAVEQMDDDCHSRSGLMCDRDDRGRCTSINRGDVLALVNRKADS